MNFFKENQTAILVVVILIVAFFAYTYFFTGKEEGAILQTEEVSIAAPADQDLISLLLQLKAITLSDAIFSDPEFKSLHDFSQELVDEPIGRINPFAPLGQGQAQPAPTLPAGQGTSR